MAELEEEAPLLHALSEEEDRGECAEAETAQEVLCTC